MREKNKLKMDLLEIRNLINLDKTNWINMTSTNCYAYALGLDVPEYKIANFAYIPGVMSQSDIFLPNFGLFTYDSLINNIYSDMEALKIEIKEINPLDDVSYDEWKVALFITKYYNLLDDYHFLRQSKNGIWYHKSGYNGGIFMCDNHGKIITNPKESYFNCRTYNKCFSLKLKK